MSNIFENGYNKRFGCLWIEDISDGIVESFKGIACEYGKEPYKVESLSDVSKKVVWWSNIPNAACWSYGRFKTLKPNEFLGISLENLVLTYCADKDEVEKKIGYFADIFKRLYYYLSEKFHNGQHYSLSDGQLSDHFLMLKDVDTVKESDITIEELEIANRSFLSVFKAKDYIFNTDRKKLTFYVPSIPLFKSIDNINIPKGNWSVLEVNTDRVDILNIVQSLELPYIVKVSSWKFRNENFSYLMDRNQNQHINRNYKDLCWYTKNEFDFLCRYATPNIEAVYTASQWTTLNQFPSFLGELEDYSISQQIIWNSWWNAYTQICRKPYTREKEPLTVVKSWLKAEQRISILPYVFKFHEEDILIESYGDNCITVWCNESEIEKAKNIALETGLVLPASLQPGFSYYQDYFDFNPLFGLDKKFMQYSAFNSLLIEKSQWLNMDYLVVPEFESNAGQILKSASKSLIDLKEYLNNSQKSTYESLLKKQARIAVDYIKNKKS